jgi:RNA polymerase sigma-70 factor (ECF subfamily)
MDTVTQELIEAARAAPDGIEPLLEAVWPSAFRIAWGMLRDRGRAEDAAQEACIAIVRGLPSLRNPRAFRGWAYRIVVNAAISASRSVERTVGLDAAVTVGATFDGTSVDLQRALGRLSVTQRAIVLLHYYAGLNSREIAQAMSISPATIRFHLMRARSALRDALGDGSAASPQEVLSHGR